MTKEDLMEKYARLQKERKRIRNVGIIAHVHHGKTTITDSLAARAGLIADKLAGETMLTWFDPEERQRELTIYGANVCMVHDFNGEEYVINLIDTPGHVDFGGSVTRAVRAIDGAIVVVCAVEGIMPQTEVVLKQALREGVKPVLFINKVDRAIKELKLTPEQLQDRFTRIIKEVNELIFDLSPPQFKEKWQVKVNDGSVAFGSGVDHWATSIPLMQKKGINFKDILESYKKGEEAVAEISKKAQIHEVVLDMVIRHLQSPIEAQPIKMPFIWKGEPDSEEGKAMSACDPNGPLVIGINKVIIDPFAGEIAMGRIFSGTLHTGDEVYVSSMKLPVKIQQVNVYRVTKRFPVIEVGCGNMVGIVGLKGASSGDTVSSKPIEPFEAIKHIFDPVITKAIEPKNATEIAKLIQVLKNMEKEDPTLQIEINQETGETLISGLGELHLEIVEHKIVRDNKIELKISPPVVVYRETVNKKSNLEEGKSPNKHNKFYFTVEPLPENLYQAIVKHEIDEGERKKKAKEGIEELIALGMDRDDAKRLRSVYNKNMFFDMTSGIVQLEEVMELVIQGFKMVMKAGPLAGEPCEGIRVNLADANLHEDAIHRGPAQVYPAIREGIRACFNTADPALLEPVQTRRIDCPTDFIGAVNSLVQSKRGQLTDMTQEGNSATIVAKMPVSTTFGFVSDLRSSTAGRGIWSLIDSYFTKVPREIQAEAIAKIKQRKGMTE